jgi:NDP-sugar pyrophosphorylase family protein
MLAVILAGGKGRRLLPFTTIVPKPLFPVGERPILQIIIEQLKEFGVRDFIISLGYLGELIEAYLGDGAKFNCKISYVREDEPLGTAGAISLLPDLGDDFFFMNGDILTTMNFSAAYKQHKSDSSIMTICAYEKKVKSSLGVLQIDADNNVIDYLEKPENTFLVSTGIYVLSPAVKKYVNKNERLDLPGLAKRLIAQGHRVKSFRIDGDWFDIGTPGDLELALTYFERKQQ